MGSAQFIELGPALILVDAVVVHTARAPGVSARSSCTRPLARRAAHWWLECRRERVAFYERLGFSFVDEIEVPPLIKRRIGSNPSRRQHFLHRSTLTSDEHTTT